MKQNINKYIGRRVRLINPCGYQNYEGDIISVEKIGKDIWADVKWDVLYYPCVSPINIINLEILKRRRRKK